MQSRSMQKIRINDVKVKADYRKLLFRFLSGPADDVIP